MTGSTHSALVDCLRPRLEPLPDPSDPAFGACIDRFGTARLVLLGEATHGTAEFYRARAAMTRRLVARHGFRLVAVEADWPDAAAIDRFLRRRAEAAFPEEAFARFPSWMWRNREILDLAEDLRAFNAGRPSEDQVRFRGLDVYSLGASMRAVLDYLDAIDPAAARQARDRYGCLSPWHAKPERYGREVMFGAKHPCEAAVTQILRGLQDQRLAYAAQDPEAYLDAAQNARIVRAAEQYYRIMYRGSVESWNIRDRHMFDTLRHLMAEGARAVVWAHNSHIGHAGATAMGWEGEFNIGELARTAFGDEAVLVGFGTDRGTVAAAEDWDAPMQVMAVRPVREDSHEALFRAAGMPRAFLDLRDPQSGGLREAWAQPRRERAIGVVYRPRTELQSHYFEAVLPEQFDAYVWFEETTAVTPLPPAKARAGESETYPTGL
ncbi:erythromycin esterase family protein [Methylobacterium sp. ID0610]|uniref:erythromycin esterase family protein n=1 Tax=Methylobacterium carpenticola TaxID=3344827 RepID=UPI00368465AD